MADLHAQLAAVRAACPLPARRQSPATPGPTSRQVAVTTSCSSSPAPWARPTLHSSTSSPSRTTTGSSRSDYPATIATLPPLIDGLRHALAALDVTRAHVVGGSYSGLVAQFLASRHPDRVASLLLSNIGAPDPTYAPALAARRQPARLPCPSLSSTPSCARPSASSCAATPLPQRFWRAYFAAAIPTLRKQAMVARLRLTAEMHAAWRRPAPQPLPRPRPHRGRRPGRPRPRTPTHGPAHPVPAGPPRSLANKGHVASLDEAAAYIAIYQEFLCHRTLRNRR